MNILEALNLCKGGGHKVRPKCWNDPESYYDKWVEWCGTDFQKISYRRASGQSSPHSAGLSSLAELLGEWEVVE